ncbi:glycosyl transferases group 1 [Terrimicrobium sacchariphilum]|uniref:Glycosyl transferases group 1 n=1 Tax=Terrimicrobium sacchariphilum TaxID=690879 RepID=A0A146GDE7_TERSA|nr:glycosyltransferase [Terrimicrobium sacchariphilum]GAT35371.1 glycosyl transferases group 1 [Terrimicrobium sacchariphilum]
MKVAIVLTTRWWRASIDQDGYCAALARLGHEPFLYCLGNDAGEADFPVVVASPAEMSDVGYWRRQGLDIAIVFNWLKGSLLLNALRQAGTRTVTRADSDGLASVRVFPRETLSLCLSSAQTARDRFREGVHWVRRYFHLSREEDAEILATAAASDAIAIESQEAAENLNVIFTHYGREELAERIAVVPHSVKDEFLTAPIGGAIRPPLIFCGGRWDDVQKDAPLLRRTIRRVLAEREDVRFVVAGAGMENFSTLTRESRVRLAGRIPRGELRNILAEARFLLASSRWETQPIGSLEALCLGATVVAPLLPGFIALVDQGASGTLATHRDDASLARATLAELQRWDHHQRDPERISRKWRDRVSNEAVVAGLLKSVA